MWEEASRAESQGPELEGAVGRPGAIRILVPWIKTPTWGQHSLEQGWINRGLKERALGGEGCRGNRTQRPGLSGGLFCNTCPGHRVSLICQGQLGQRGKPISSQGPLGMQTGPWQRNEPASNLALRGSLCPARKTPRAPHFSSGTEAP